MTRFKDITGQRFGRLVALEPAGSDIRGCTHWLCRCDCQNTCVIEGKRLRNGNTHSCGCKKKERQKEFGKRLRLDLTGQRFGRLVAIQPTGTNSTRQVRWLCQCDCGNLHTVTAAHLKAGTVKSCGCSKKEHPGGAPTHGFTRRGKQHPLYSIWHSMRDRCNRPNHPRFKEWGGRGIKVCKRWNDFTNFLADMGERPPGKVLDRYPNQNGNYEPGNCRWATYSESNRNRRPPKVRSDSRTGIKGVHRCGGRWQVIVYHRGKRFRRGIFDTVEEASNAYQEAAKRLRG